MKRILNKLNAFHADRSACIREEVAEFALAMEAKLAKNDHKTGWKEQPVEAHIKLLKIELMEFETALEFLTLDEACKELVDLGNYAMIIRDKLKNQGRAAFRHPDNYHAVEKKP